MYNVKKLKKTLLTYAHHIILYMIICTNYSIRHCSILEFKCTDIKIKRQQINCD